MQWIKRHRRSLGLFAILLLSYGYFFPRWASWSQNSRLDLIMAMVDDRTLCIDRYYANTGDYAEFNGHYYSDKAPGVAFLGVPFYAVYKGLVALPAVEPLVYRLAQSRAFAATLNESGTGLLIDKIEFALALYFVTFFIVAVPAAFLGVLLYNLLARWGVSEMGRIATTLIYGLATPAFAFSGMLFSHQLVACLLFAAFYLVVVGWGRLGPSGALFLAGLLLGWAVISEYPAALVAGAIGLYAVWVHRSPARLVWAALGALLPGTLLMAYDWAIFGSLLPVGYLYSVNYQNVHGQGLISIIGLQPGALFGITFGPMRGLFFLSPILLLAVWGLAVWWRSKLHRPEWLVSVWAVISLFLFNASSVMWQGGFSVGPRYVLPMLPFMMLGLGMVWDRLTASRLGKAAIVVLTVWSAAAVWLETISGQSFPDWTPNPLINYSLPKFIAGDIARNAGMAVGLRQHWSLLPLLVAVAAVAWLCFRDGGLRLEQKNGK